MFCFYTLSFFLVKSYNFWELNPYSFCSLQSKAEVHLATLVQPHTHGRQTKTPSSVLKQHLARKILIPIALSFGKIQILS